MDKTLKYYSAYLPYKVQVMGVVQAYSGNPPEPSHDEEVECDLTLNNIEKHFNRKSPLILRPLSDIFKPIKLSNGTELIVAKLLWSVEVSEENSFEDFGTMPEYWIDSFTQLKDDHRNEDYGNIQTLLKYHFDIFNLIENKFALIKKNTEI